MLLEALSRVRRRRKSRGIFINNYAPQTTPFAVETPKGYALFSTANTQKVMHMIRLSTYLSKDKQANYTNPVTGENWKEEQLRLRYRRSYNFHNYGLEYAGMIFKMLLGLLPIGLIVYIYIYGL